MNVINLCEEALEQLDELLDAFDEASNKTTDERQASQLANVGSRIIQTMDYIKSIQQ